MTDDEQTLLRLRMLLTHLTAHEHDHEIAHYAEALDLPAESRRLLDQALDEAARARRSFDALLTSLGGPLSP